MAQAAIRRAGVSMATVFIATPEELEAGMKAALASDADLSDWITPQHDDAAVRRYLKGLLEGLEARLPPNI